MTAAGSCDDVFFHVLKECKTLPVFLDEVFGFLKRCTDFYVVAEEPGSPIGLPPNFAEVMVHNSFKKWATDEKKIIASCDSTTSLHPMQNEDIDSTNSTEPPPEENKPSTSYVAVAESYNGGSNDRYSWSQTINELDVIINVPANISTRNLNVSIASQCISIKIRPTEETLFSGTLPHKIKHADALWSLDQEQHQLAVHLDKVQEIWWDRLVEGEDPLDISKIDCSRPFEELSDEAQAKIEELQWNQERKRLGLPTSQQLQAEEMLRKSWNAEGSPFQGPYNPGAVIMEQ